MKSFQHLQCCPSTQVLLGLQSLNPDLGSTNQLCQIMHFSKEPAGPSSKEDRGREHGLQGFILLSKIRRPWGKWCMCSSFQYRDFLITSYHLKLTTEASKIQMRDGLMEERRCEWDFHRWEKALGVQCPSIKCESHLFYISVTAVYTLHCS